MCPRGRRATLAGRGNGAPAAASGFAKRWAHRRHFISWEEEEETRECRELAKEEGKKGGVEALPALEDEEGDVEGGSR